MKQKIVINVQVRCEKCRSEALKIAAAADGVISLALEGEDKDKVVVIGDGVDSVNLTICLAKKLGHAILESVEELKQQGSEVQNGKANTTPSPSPIMYESICQQGRHCELYTVVCESHPSTCTIM